MNKQYLRPLCGTLVVCLAAFGAKAAVFKVGKPLFTSAELWSDSLCCGLVLTNAFIEGRAEDASYFVQSYKTAGKNLNKERAKEIAKKYLVPKNLEKNGLAKNQVKYTKAALLEIAEEYARESGVRNYEKCLDKIHRKIVTDMIVEQEKDAKTDMKKQLTIDAPDLFKYLGKPVFDESQIKVAAVPGTAIGLAWTSMGGDTLMIESSYFAGKAGLVLTGQMGDVMKESSQIAFDWSRKFVLERGVKDAKWFEDNIVHLHIPEGATPKDGPSAGITMATTFVSLLMDKKIKPHLAMTGELSLTGQVLPIGGLREKTVAAKRNKIKTIIIPKANERDLEEIPAHVKQGIKFIPVSDVREVLESALGVK